MRLAAFVTLLLALSAPATPAAAGDTLTVVTLNLWHDQRDWPRRLVKITGELERLRPDVICLQEVLQHPQLRNQAETLAESLGCHVQFASADGPESPKRYGNAVLTPHRVLTGGARNLEPADDYRVVAHVRFEWRGRAIDAYSTHLHHTREGGATRARQVRHLLAIVDSTRGTGPVVLAGDFNAELSAPEMSRVTERYVDAFHALHPRASREEAATFNRRFGPDPGAIDHIFVARGGKTAPRPVACEVIFRDAGSDSLWASDHFGVVAKVEMASAATRSAVEATPGRLPNIVFILADDVGYGDVGIYGGRVPTPNIDRLAREGMRFTDAHAPAALCAPSRFSLLTGSNPHRNGRPGGSWNINFSCGFHTGAGHLPEQRHLTVAEVLARAGYRSAFLGKMHLGGTARDRVGVPIREEPGIGRMDFSRGIECFPHEHGFDYALGLPSGIQHEPFAFFEQGRYKPLARGDPADNRSTRRWVNGRHQVGDNGTSAIVEHPPERPGVGDRRYDSSQVGRILADSAAGWIDRHLASGSGSPFLLYYSSQAIHVPHTPPLRFGADGPRVASTTGGATSDMIAELDLQVGKILAKLDHAGIAANTLVFFTSDNGALWPDAVQYGDSLHDNNGPWRDYKASVYEGGHRVPFIARWGDGTTARSHIAPGAVSGALVLCQDWIATVYELAGQGVGEGQAMDSGSLLPLLTGRAPPGRPIHDFVIHQAGYAYDGALRRGDWVLLVDRQNRPTELYDLATDPAQQRNRIAEPDQAQRVAEMRALFLKHNDHVDATHEPRTTPAIHAGGRVERRE